MMKEAVKEKDPRRLECCCHALLAVLTSDGIEIKCRRCQRIVLIPKEEIHRRCS